MLILICFHNHLEQDGTEGQKIMQMNIKAGKSFNCTPDFNKKHSYLEPMKGNK